ncbi:hypothetical protein LCGC14_0540620 [marine sediment metagenome]|uniref:Uncharacterized protein n=1 Tax=marine sediment metagenome TaxID=412755 RepID=A0A0F9RXN2_9ZZZZ
MAKIDDFSVESFDGGLVTDKSDFELQRNEFKDTLNMEFEEMGKAKRRRGIMQFGDTKTGKTFDESFIFTPQVLGSVPTALHLVFDRASTGTIFKVAGTYLTSAVAVGDNVINVDRVNTHFAAATAVININGDDIDYTGKTAETFTGAGGMDIDKAHPNRSLVQQIVSIGTGTDTQLGAYVSALNNLLFICGRLGSKTLAADGSTISALLNPGPAGLFATNYRNRIYVAGSGATDGATTRNGSPIVISFSALNDPTDWSGFATDQEIVEDDRGEMITGLEEFADNLFIFKMNSMFSYDEITLQQRLFDVGAYNQRVVQRIDKLLYTFCPQGVFVTDGNTAKKISEPIEKYLKEFHPVFDASLGRVVLNTFAGKYKKKYYLYLEIIKLDGTLKEDVVLVYDTIRKNWTVYDNFENFTHLGSLNGFHTGQTIASTAGVFQPVESLFAGDTNGKYWKLFDKRYLDNESTKRPQGGDIIANRLGDPVAGDPISTVLETPFYDLGSPIWKTIGHITFLVEEGEFDISYRLDRGNNITDWFPLGNFSRTVKESRVLASGKNQGYRISFKVTGNTLASISKFNGFVVKDINTQDEKRKWQTK